jgi:hypothetical protein
MVWLTLFSQGCAYRIGSGLVAGALDEAGGQGRSVGVEEVGDRMIERALLVELGHQLGAGLSSGATEVTPEQQEALERVIDGLLATAARRAGKGLRRDVSPELRDMVRTAIVESLSDGLKGELGDSLEHTVDRVVTKAVVALRTQLEDDHMRYAISDLLRDSIYFAMRENQGGTPAIGETLQFTLSENVLDPLAQTVGGLTDGVAYNINESARRTESTLRAIIGAMFVITGVFFLLYLMRGRQLRRAQETQQKAEAGQRAVDAALDVLDDATRKQVLGKVHEIASDSDADEKPVQRSDDYTRKD